MIVHRFSLPKYEWEITAFIIDRDIFPGIIISALMEADCPNSTEMVQDILDAGYNAGLTFTNGELRCTIIVIGETTSAEEFQSTLDHEKGHAATHIALYNDIDLTGETYQYLVGDIGRNLYQSCKELLCEHCRNKIYS